MTVAELTENNTTAIIFKGDCPPALEPVGGLLYRMVAESEDGTSVCRYCLWVNKKAYGVQLGDWVVVTGNDIRVIPAASVGPN